MREKGRGLDGGEVLEDGVARRFGEDAGAASGEEALGAEGLVLFEAGGFFEELGAGWAGRQWGGWTLGEGGRGAHPHLGTEEGVAEGHEVGVIWV